jgi:thioredoxin-like negative regulator of GroEL
VSLDEGLARAARTRQPVLVYVQAQWCPRCRELEPLFDEAQVREAAAPLIMVRHDGDEPHPALRGVIGDMDGYVPRVYFLQADGVRMSALTSGHPRYTWFYTPSMQPRLVQNMRDAVAAAPGLP